MSRPAWMREVPDEEADALARETVPGWAAPMLATLSHDTFSDPDWIYERKLDGERCLVFRDGGVPRIVSRNPPHGDHVHWVRPELVAEVGFTEWTRDARLRHPRFIGLRDDRDAKDVVRERPREA